jgi:membrane associated rhomboid family serine protease
MTPAVKLIIATTVGAWLVTVFAPSLMTGFFGLTPEAVLTQGRVWQLATYLFVHDQGGVSHILFNMLYVWMFGVELERRWGTQAFARYYFIVGIGAGLCVILGSFLPMPAAQLAWSIPTIGASGAGYGILLAWAMVFPHRQILFMLIFPINARVFAILMGAISFFYVVGGRAGPVSDIAHLGGMVIGYLYLKGPGNLRLDMKYHLTRWRMERLRRKFDVHRGGRGDGGWNDRIH